MRMVLPRLVKRVVHTRPVARRSTQYHAFQTRNACCQSVGIFGDPERIRLPLRNLLRASEYFRCLLQGPIQIPPNRPYHISQQHARHWSVNTGLWAVKHSMEPDIVLCIARANWILDVPAPKADWLICFWRRAADVFMQDTGDQALIGQDFLSGALLEHLNVGDR